MGLLDDKVAIVTGGAQGLGLEHAYALAEQGCRVILGDVQDDMGEVNAKEARSSGLDVTYLHLDVTSATNWSDVLTLITNKFGSLTTLVNNASINYPRVPLEDRAVSDWDRIIEINLKGVFLGIRAAIPFMRENGGGSIINIASIAAISQYEIQEQAYATSKGAVVTLTKVIASQYAKENIRCNAICPGPTDGGMLRTFLPDEEKLKNRLKRVPMGRFGRPREIANGVVFFASELSAFITGAILPIDGASSVQ